jgi:hypothetical protein
VLLILQKQENEKTPVSDAQKTLGMKMVAMLPAIPANRNTHHTFVPK